MKPIEEMTELEKLQQLDELTESMFERGEHLLWTCVAELYRTRYELNCYHEGKIAAAKIDKGKGI